MDHCQLSFNLLINPVTQLTSRESTAAYMISIQPLNVA